MTLPGSVAPLAIQGVTSCWLRARLVSGDYGQGLVTSTDGKSVTFDAYVPPILQSVQLSSTRTAPGSCV